MGSKGTLDPYTGPLKIPHPLPGQELTQSQLLTENLLWLLLPLIQTLPPPPSLNCSVILTPPRGKKNIPGLWAKAQAILCAEGSLPHPAHSPKFRISQPS